MWANLTSKARLKLGHAMDNDTKHSSKSTATRLEKNQDVAGALSKPWPQCDIKAMAGAVCKLISNWAMWETHKMIYFQAAAAKCCCTSYWIMLSFSQHCMLVVFFVAVQRAAWNLIKRHKFDFECGSVCDGCATILLFLTRNINLIFFPFFWTSSEQCSSRFPEMQFHSIHPLKSIINTEQESECHKV